MKVQSGRLDHLGIVAGIIKEVGLIEMIDQRIPQDSRESISTGEAVAGMIINGLGFSDRPMTLTPQFFQSKAMDRLFREGVTGDHFNRFKLGRALDSCYDYGCDALFTEVSLAVCQQQGVDCKFNSEDTTSFTLSGEYDQECDEQAIEITHGYSKDHRPDLKQAMLELMVTQDGGVPIISRAWSGNASDSKIFRERSIALVESFKKSSTPRYLVADSKLYSKETVEGPLGEIQFITRVPSTINREQTAITDALKIPLKEWTELDERNRCHTINLEHYGQNQRWIVVSSEDMKARSKKSVEKVVQREQKELEKELVKLGKQEFSCRTDAENSLELIRKQAKYHRIEAEEITEKKKFKGKGRPKEDADYSIVYRPQGGLVKDQSVIKDRIAQKSCYVLATPIPTDELSSEEVVAAYKGQNSSVERGFRFLKDPLFFTSSLFVKKTERIMGLLMVMTLALLIYSIAQRRLRAHLSSMHQTLPNQIKKEISNPTLRWIFQLMEGIEFLRVTVEGSIHETISGLTDLRKRILCCFPPQVQKIYGMAA